MTIIPIKSQYQGRQNIKAHLCDRREFLKILGASVTWFSLSSRVQGSNTTSMCDLPNVIFVIVDDMGWVDLSCYGGNKQGIKTPNIDRMAEEGVRFTQAYSGAPVCAPSRSSLITGQHVGHTTVRTNTGGIPLRLEDITIPQLLKKRGYETGGFGKWGLGDIQTTGVPEKKGFDVFYGYYHQVHAHSYYPSYLWRNSRKVSLPKNQGSENGEAYSHYLILEETLKFIRENRTRPFFCYCAWTLPHGYFEIPESDPAWQEFKDRPWPKQARVYAAMIRVVDRSMGEILALLKKLNIDDRTIVFFCSDNGGSRFFDNLFNPNGPLRGEKGTLYEGGIRVPMIVRWPGKTSYGSVSDHVCFFPDIMPTLAELAGVNPPKVTDGVSIVPTLLGENIVGHKQRQHDYLYWEYYGSKSKERCWAVRAGYWKGVSSGGEFELYDLQKDIGECHNVAGQNPQIVERIKSYARRAYLSSPPQLEPTPPNGQRFR